MHDRRGEIDERRRNLFRRMEWLFVYFPPILAVIVAMAAGAFLAWFVWIEGTNFWGRWAAFSAAIVLIPLCGYLIRSWWENRR